MYNMKKNVARVKTEDVSNTRLAFEVSNSMQLQFLRERAPTFWLKIW